MHLSTSVLFAAAVFISAFAAPGQLDPIQVETVSGLKSGRHIVRLKSNIVHGSFLESMNIVPSHNWTVINGFAGEFNPDEMVRLLAHSDVESIAEDGIVRGALVDTQTNATWGLARLSSRKKLVMQGPRQIDTPFLGDSLKFQFTFETTAGSGVDIYVVDTGIYTNHIEFGGRARWGATFGGYASADGHGHGTHCAGTAVGRTVGVARAANVIAVKVLNDQNISGLNWVYQQALATRRPSVASLSLYADSPNTAFDDAVTQLTRVGIHAIVAAGNNNADATFASPSRAAGAIVVGASTINDTRASFSNYRSVVALFAAGENVISAGNTDPTSFRIMSGTSMATPHVAGLVAFLISSQGNTTPAAMRSRVQNSALNGVLENIPSGTINKLAQNGLAVVN